MGMIALAVDSEAPEESGPPYKMGVSLRSELVVLFSLSLVWTVMAVVINPVGDFPLNDDWAYALAVRSLLDTGRFTLLGPIVANQVAQVYWGALFCLPFGFSFTALRISTLVLGGTGILALYLLLRELGAQRQIALAGAFTLAVNPFYLGLSLTFMTDVPFISVITLSLWLYVRGARRGDAVSLGLAVVLSFVAILIRQFALMLPLAFGIAHITRKGTGGRALAIAALPIVLGIALHLAYQRWLLTTGRIPSVAAQLGLPNSVFRFVLHGGHVTVQFLSYVGLCAAPFLAYLSFTRRARTEVTVWSSSFSWKVSVLLTVVLTATFAALGDILPALGNVLAPFGLGPLTLRDTYVLHTNEPRVAAIVTGLWGFATALSAWVAVLFLLAVSRTLTSLVRNARWPERRRLAWPQVLFIMVIVSYVGGMVLISNDRLMFDRYVLPLIPPVLAILLIDTSNSRLVPERSKRMMQCFLLVLYAAFSVTATHDYLAWNRARWAATDFLLQAGVTPQRIDGGYEFNGWYLYSPDYIDKPGKSWWWVDDDEYIIASGPLSGYEETGRFRVSSWLGLGESSVLILHRLAK
jgi:4-amino-4-deoxy-L-arabinose transferase-like glycosyltransferase